jgi:hypothetical protein
VEAADEVEVVMGKDAGEIEMKILAEATRGKEM